jgi:hypothetical protein
VYTAFNETVSGGRMPPLRYRGLKSIEPRRLTFRLMKSFFFRRPVYRDKHRGAAGYAAY